jgi:hypothetical protein
MGFPHTLTVMLTQMITASRAERSVRKAALASTFHAKLYAHRNTRHRTQRYTKLLASTHMMGTTAGIQFRRSGLTTVCSDAEEIGIQKSILRFMAATPSPLPVITRPSIGMRENCMPCPPTREARSRKSLHFSGCFLLSLGSTSLHPSFTLGGVPKAILKHDRDYFFAAGLVVSETRCSDLYRFVTGKYLLSLPVDGECCAFVAVRDVWLHLCRHLCIGRWFLTGGW